MIGSPGGELKLLPIGSRLIDSMPQASAISTLPLFTSAAGNIQVLLTRPTLRINRGGGHAQWQAGTKPSGTNNVVLLLSDLADTSPDDLTNRSGIDSYPLKCGHLNMSEQISRVHGREATISTADRAASSGDDYDILLAEHKSS